MCFWRRSTIMTSYLAAKMLHRRRRIRFASNNKIARGVKFMKDFWNWQSDQSSLSSWRNFATLATQNAPIEDFGTVLTLSIRTSQRLPYFFLNFNKYNLLPNIVSKNCWMSGKQCRPWRDAAFCGVLSGSTLFAQACLSEHIRYLFILPFLVAITCEFS